MRTIFAHNCCDRFKTFIIYHYHHHNELCSIRLNWLFLIPLEVADPPPPPFRSQRTIRPNGLYSCACFRTLSSCLFSFCTGLYCNQFMVVLNFALKHIRVLLLTSVFSLRSSLVINSKGRINPICAASCLLAYFSEEPKSHCHILKWLLSSCCDVLVRFC
jgi:hypothetical protein